MKFILLALGLSLSLSASEPLTRYEILSGRKTSVEDSREFWDKRYAENNYVYGKSPAPSLAQNIDYLQGPLRVLDVGMGEGRNAVFLARKGHQVVGVDISPVAIQKAKQLARESNVRIETVLSSMDKYNPAPGSFDVIICYYYVDKEIHAKFMEWLRPGGLLFYEAYTKRQSGRGDSSYHLEEGEVLGLFPGLRILKYEEPLHREEFSAFVIARKPRLK